MAHLHQVPSQYRDTAKGIPSDVLAKLTPAQATARAVASERWQESGIAHADPVTARAALQLAGAVLKADPAVAADYLAKAAATTDTVLRSGYFAAATQSEEDSPTGADLAKAQQALNAMNRMAPTPRRVSRVDAATARADKLMAEIKATGASLPRLASPPVTKQDEIAAPAMLYKAHKTADHYRQMADQVTDPETRRGYLDLAAKMEGTR